MNNTSENKNDKKPGDILGINIAMNNYMMRKEEMKAKGLLTYHLCLNSCYEDINNF